jgi:hypothetical protein
MTRGALLSRGGAIAAATIAGALWLHAKGPVRVIVGTTEIDEFAPTWYMLSAFPVLGMLAADLVERAKRFGLLARDTLLFAGCAAVVVAVANLRLGARLPISGHVLLLSYFLVHRLASRPWPPIALGEFVTALAILVAVTAIKLLRWRDWTTWSVGLAAGTSLALLCAYFLNVPRTPPETSAVTSRSTDGSLRPPGAAR